MNKCMYVSFNPKQWRKHINIKEPLSGVRNLGREPEAMITTTPWSTSSAINLWGKCKDVLLFGFDISNVN